MTPVPPWPVPNRPPATPPRPGPPPAQTFKAAGPHPRPDAMVFDRSDRPKKLFFVTSNPYKVEEAREAFEAAGLDLPLEQAAVDAPELQADTLPEVARFTCEQVRQRFRGDFFLEDAGLFVDALDGFPGVYSSYVFGTVGLEGLLRLMEDVPEGERTARFESCVALQVGKGKPKLFLGTCEGRILDQVREGRAFGFDPVFAPAGDDRAFSEIPLDEKNKLSHRGQALAQLVEHLQDLE